MRQTCIQVLLVDDDEDYFFITRDLLSDIEGVCYQVTWKPNLEIAHQAIETQDFDVCLVDYRLGKETGLDFIRSLLEAGIEVPVILMTGQGDRSIDLEAMNLGTADYLNKGDLKASLLERTIRYAIERARYLRQLREYAASLEAKNRELDAYTYTIAHDLTNPLNIVLGYVGLVLLNEENKLSTNSSDMLHTVENQALKMSEMVSQLLWLAHLRDASEAITPMEIESIAKSSISRFVDRIQNQGISIIVESPMPIAMGQGIWVEEIFANLISNAIKYIGESNPAPQIRIRGYRNNKIAIFEVEDNGIGITEENQNHLFEMFTRIRTKETRDIPGLGLGLSIVHRIVSKLGGEVGVRSTPHKGSTFWFSLALPEKH